MPMHDRPAVLDDRTLTSPVIQAEASGPGLLGLTLVWHPQADGLGRQALLEPGQRMALNRFHPAFGAPGSDDRAPLGVPCVSRDPVGLAWEPDGSLVIDVPGGRMRCEIDGRPMAPGSTVLPPQALDAGVMLSLGGLVILCVHRVATLPEPDGDDALVGRSSAMVRVRRLVRQAAATDLPVLVLGESGTGKELVARDLHRQGPRRAGPLVNVNMAALTDSLAAADLFGTVRGAYTGAQAARPGLFAEARGGTLFLDEVGDTPPTVQTMLLRAVETGEYRPLGSSRVERADVRLVAATDRDLGGDAFNQPLRRRLEAFVVRLPPLRQRREDLGLLMRHLLRPLNDGDRLLARWAEVPADLARAICLHAWPGNVRELRHVLQRLLVSWQAGAWPSVEDLVGPPPALGAAGAATAPAPAAGTAPRPAYRAPGDVSADEVLAALAASDWCIRPAAQRLGVSRPSFYNLIAVHPAIRRADDVAAPELESLFAQGMRDLGALAAALHTPREALRRHLRALGLEHRVDAAPGTPED